MEVDKHYSEQLLPEKSVVPKDRKKTMNNSLQERGFITGNLLSFLSGLSIGLLVAFIVFLRYQVIEPGATAALTGPVPGKENQEQADEGKPVVEYTFYDTLRDKQVTISEWVARGKDILEDKETDDSESEPQGVDEDGGGDDTPERPANDDVSGYVLQVGSFREFNAADRVKAELALLGIFADIQRVMLNEQDVRHRVRLGPFQNVDEMRGIRQRLEENSIDFVLLELRTDKDTT